MVLLALALGCTFFDEATPRGPRTAPRHGEHTGASTDTSLDTGDTGASTDTGETGGLDAGDSGQGGDTGTSTDTGTDTGDTGTSTDTSTDTGASSDTSADTGDTWWDGRDTAAPVDTGSTDTASGDTGGTVDTAWDGRDTAAPMDTGATDTAPGDSGGATDTVWDGRDTSLDTSPDTAVDTSDTSSDSGTDTADTVGTGSSTPLRFLAVGDAGDGSLGQRAVAAAMGDVCAAQGCDFVLFLGDNFYPIGVSSTTDPQWTTKFESVYTDPSLAIPFYAVLGNHDYGLSYTLTRAQAQVDYTAVSSRWEMADLYWSATIGDALFLGLDTEAWANEDGADQQPWADAELAASSATWRFALGHHPYLSNGPHGDAGEWDGRAGEGESFRDFFDASLCGNIDAYFFGHDHLLQWIDAPCGVAQLGSGSGARTYSSIGAHTPRFEAVVEGFVWIEIDGRTLTTVWYDDTAAELYRDTITK